MLVDPPADGDWNMAADLFLLESATRPSLRLYRWNGPWLSLGYAQRWQRPLPAEIRCVRRPSGGRAVLHDGDLTYAIVLPHAEGTVAQHYAELAALWSETLSRLGFPVEAAADSSRLGSNPNCYAGLQGGEIVLAGRKLIGSAQLRRGRRLLQHGSIPLCPDPERFLSLFPDSPPPAGLGLVSAEQLWQNFPLALERSDWEPAERAAILSKQREFACPH